MLLRVPNVEKPIAEYGNTPSSVGLSPWYRAKGPSFHKRNEGNERA